MHVCMCVFVCVGMHVYVRVYDLRFLEAFLPRMGASSIICIRGMCLGCVPCGWYTGTEVKNRPISQIKKSSENSCLSC